MDNVKSYRAVARYNAKKVINNELLYQLRCDGFGDDLAQEIRIAEFQSEKEKLDLRQSSNLAQRLIYRFLKNYGLIREKGGKGFSSREIFDGGD